MIDLGTEKIADVAGEIDSLLAMHYDEIAADKHLIKLDPDWGKYESLERDDSLRIFTARHEGKLIGYSVFFLAWHPHYKSNLFAQNDILYLHPDHRKGRDGIRLIHYSEEQLKKDRVDKIMWHVKVKNDWRKILARMGYVEQDVIMAKAV